MRVLIVDDEAPARERLRLQLGEIGGVEILGEAENGPQALTLVTELNPDIVLLDIRMPGIDGLQVARYWTNECQHCPVKSRCTTGTERRVTRWEYEHLVDEMRARLRSEDDPMTLRRSTVEHPFGTIKAWMGATHFLCRRLPKVSAEMSLHVLAYNMKRVMKIMGTGEMIEALRA